MCSITKLNLTHVKLCRREHSQIANAKRLIGTILAKYNYIITWKESKGREIIYIIKIV
jgi:hypothetical protein